MFADLAQSREQPERDVDRGQRHRQPEGERTLVSLKRREKGPEWRRCKPQRSRGGQGPSAESAGEHSRVLLQQKSVVAAWCASRFCLLLPQPRPVPPCPPAVSQPVALRLQGAQPGSVRCDHKPATPPRAEGGALRVLNHRRQQQALQRGRLGRFGERGQHLERPAMLL